MPAAETQAIQFFINGKEHIVPKSLPLTTSLNDFLREVVGLPGTKVMCREAGCGCCSVAVTHALPDSDKLETYSIQSCITPLYMVDGWQISTVEGIGNQKDGFHPIQDRIAKFNGSQCGYCTPGMVMNMYGLLHQKPELTSQDVEDNFDGNICRCTGYRPILDAMKSFAEDSNAQHTKRIDIEDLNKHLCPKTGDVCTNDQGGKRCLNLDLGNARWFRPGSLNDIGEIFHNHKDSKVRIVYGNTASGIYKNDGPFDVYIDLHRVKDIFSFEVMDTEVKIGAGHTLTRLISKLKGNQDKPGFGYFSHLVQHIKVVANVMVRNSGSVAGNLMIKHSHPEFPSDLFTIFEAAGATVQVTDCLSGNKMTTHSLSDFLKHVDMIGKVMTAVLFPKHDSNEVFRSFKITPRWQNAHAYVNAGFRFAVDGQTITGKPSVVLGGINAQTIHAEKTEEFLKGKTLSNDVVKEALVTLKGELDPDADQLLASPKYRKDLACSLLYKASGEAVYVNDMPKLQHELFVAFVQAEEGNATLDFVDASEALQMPGVVRFLTAEDIPEGGVNGTMPVGFIPLVEEELFATKEICFCGQPVGAIIAESRSQAFAAVSKVKINYAEVRKPLLDLDEIIAEGKEYDFPLKEKLVGNPDEAMRTADKVISGEVRMGSQTHFFMETHVTLAVPSEDGIDVYSPTQYPDMCQAAAATVIGKPLNFINVTVPRVGGAFGGKIFDNSATNALASLSAYITGRPVRSVQSLSNVMTMCGKRPPILAKYKAGVNNDGKVQVIEFDYYMDVGRNSTMTMDVYHHMDYYEMGYYCPNWKVRPHPMMSNRQRCSPVRAPGSVPAALVIETIMEHLAKSIDTHPIRLKELNLIEKHHVLLIEINLEHAKEDDNNWDDNDDDGWDGMDVIKLETKTVEQTDLHGHSMKDSNMRECWQRLKDLAEVEGRMRQVTAFNQNNLWKKRGLTMTTCKYNVGSFMSGHDALVSIFYRDGSVVVSTGGVEMGQGLYTKVAQGVAKVLEVPLDSIKVRPTQSVVSANAFCTGGSTGSELTMKSAMEASRILKERIQPMREKFPDLDWVQLLLKCEKNKIDLSAKSRTPVDFSNYFVYCVAATETEVDVLTGESQIRRVDLMADLGESLNPIIDIGQIEGSFVMGLGAFLSEDTVWDETTGKVLTDGTWEYKPPTTKDIPIDWRIHLLPDTPNPTGIHSSKAVGEPAISLSCGALLANRLAVESARKDLFGVEDFIQIDAPYTVEKVQQSVGIDLDNLTV